MQRILYLGLRAPTKAHLVHFPIIKTTPRSPHEPEIQRAFHRIREYTHLLFTSQTSVEIFFSFLPQFDINTKELKDKCWITVGKSTARLLRQNGFEVNISPEIETAEGVVEELKKIPLKNAYLFWPRSALARPILNDFFNLERFNLHGIRFLDCIFYDTHTHQPGPLPDLNLFDEISFTSPSTVNAFFELFDEPPKHLKLTAIGPITLSRLNHFLRLYNRLNT